MNKFCRNCGKPLEEGASFCKHCGTPVDKAMNDKHEPVSQTVEPLVSGANKSGSNTKKILIGVFSVLGLLFIISIGGIVFLFSQRQRIANSIQDSMTEKITEEISTEILNDQEALNDVIIDLEEYIDEEYVDEEYIDDYYSDGIDESWDLSNLPVGEIEGYWEGYLTAYYGDEISEEEYIDFQIITSNGEVSMVEIAYPDAIGDEYYEEIIELPAYYDEGMLYFESIEGGIEFYLFFYEDAGEVYGYANSNESDGYIYDITIWRPY